MYFILTISLILLVVVLYYLYVYLSNFGKIVNKIPGPGLVPIFGNALSLSVPSVQLNANLRNWSKRYFPTYRLWVLHRATIHIQDPDDFEALLTSSKNLNKDFAYEHFVPWLGTGLLTSKAEKWQKRRKILTPAFHFNILRKYMEIISEQGDKTTTKAKANGKEFIVELLPYCSESTLRIICESAMGVSLDNKEYKEIAKNYKNAIYKMGQMMFYRIMRPYIRDWMLPLMPTLKNEKNDIIKNLDNFIDTIVEERREYHESTGYKNVDDLDNNDKAESENIYFGKKKRLAMLDLLLSAEKKGLIDDSGIKEEVATFVFEGHDTTAMNFCYTIMLLAENVDAQKKAREEVESIMIPKDGLLEMADLQELNYLERCIKESLRLFPPLPTIVRHITDDLQLKTCFGPKGCDIAMHIIDLHRNPNYWPEADKFDPDRFLPEQVRQRHPFAFLPFSAGPRNCIGQKFALMEMKSLLARVLYNFILEPVDFTKDIEIKTDVVLRPTRPVRTKFIRIDR